MKATSYIQMRMPASPPKRLEWLIHSAVWIILFVLPYFFRDWNSDPISLQDYSRFFANTTSTLVVFYMNYSYLVERFLFRRRRLRYLLINTLLFATVIFVSLIFRRLTHIPAFDYFHAKLGDRLFIYVLLGEFGKYCFLTVVCVALKATSSWYKVDAERKELARQRSEAELQNLKNQLNPHFLFNTLNNIYSLIAINGEQAQEAVHKLSRLLRYMLYESAQVFVPLEKDMDFVRNYIRLMQIRMPAHVDLKTEIQVAKPELLIAPLLFISPVENAFKHGVSNSKPSFIHIEITATEKQIVSSIRNSFFPKDKQDKSGSGIGLVNLRKRLELLYPDDFELTCTQSDDTYSCELILKNL